MKKRKTPLSHTRRLLRSKKFVLKLDLELLVTKFNVAPVPRRHGYKWNSVPYQFVLVLVSTDQRARALDDRNKKPKKNFII